MTAAVSYHKHATELYYFVEEIRCTCHFETRNVS